MKDDPAIKACAEAMAAEVALKALIERRDPVDDDLVEADAALEAAYATIPTTAAGIATLALLALEVEEPDPHLKQVLASLRCAALNMAQIGATDSAEGEHAEVRGSTRFHAMQRSIPGVKSNTSMIA